MLIPVSSAMQNIAAAGGTPSYFTGGVVTIDGTDRVHTFNTSGTLTFVDVDGAVSIDYTVTAGDGGGVDGGTGETLTASGYSLGTTTTVTVGAGGAGTPTAGSDSSLGSIAVASGGAAGTSPGDPGAAGVVEVRYLVDPSMPPLPDVLHLDASDTGSITVGDGAPVVRVAAWGPLSQADTGDMPIYDGAYGSVTLAGSLIPLFVGDHLFQTSGLLSSHVGDMTIYMVATVNSGAADGYILADASTSANNPVVAVREAASSANLSVFYRNDAGTTVVLANDLQPNPTPGFAVISIVDDGSTIESWLDGVDGTGADNPLAYTPSGTYTTDRFAVGALRRATDGAPVSDMDLAELRIYGTAHDDATRAAVEAELAAKWGI